MRRGLKVESKAKRNLQSAPKRVNTGRLRASISHELVVWQRAPAVRIGTNVEYARFVHDGTGLYGPRGAVIVPKTKRALKFASKKYGAKKGKNKGYVFAKSVKGMQKNEFLKNALDATRG